jgi:hypothetical protein
VIGRLEENDLNNRGVMVNDLNFCALGITKTQERARVLRFVRSIYNLDTYVN